MKRAIRFAQGIVRNHFPGDRILACCVNNTCTGSPPSVFSRVLAHGILIILAAANVALRALFETKLTFAPASLGLGLSLESSQRQNGKLYFD